MTQAELIDRMAVELKTTKKRLRLVSADGMWMLKKRIHGGAWITVRMAPRLQDFLGGKS